MADARKPMHTPGGMSVRKEIDLRIEAAREEARGDALEEAVAFLRASGFENAAAALNAAAFLPAEAVSGSG